MKDIMFRKVKVPQGDALKEAEKQGLKPSDLVLLATEIYQNYPPLYSVEKVEGDAIDFLLRRCGMLENENDELKATVNGFEHGSI